MLGGLINDWPLNFNAKSASLLFKGVNFTSYCSENLIYLVLFSSLHGVFKKRSLNCLYITNQFKTSSLQIDDYQLSVLYICIGVYLLKFDLVKRFAYQPKTMEMGGVAVYCSAANFNLN